MSGRQCEVAKQCSEPVGVTVVQLSEFNVRIVVLVTLTGEMVIVTVDGARVLVGPVASRRVAEARSCQSLLVNQYE
jgi:hypothetical protein